MLPGPRLPNIKVSIASLLPYSKLPAPSTETRTQSSNYCRSDCIFAMSLKERSSGSNEALGPRVERPQGFYCIFPHNVPGFNMSPDTSSEKS